MNNPDVVVEQRAFRKVCTRKKLLDKFKEVHEKVTKRVIKGEGKPREVAEAFGTYLRATKMYNAAVDSWIECHLKLFPKRNFTTEAIFLDDEVPF
jgi:hypothetical protein